MQGPLSRARARTSQLDSQRSASRRPVHCVSIMSKSGYAIPSHQNTNDEIEPDDDDLVAISAEQLDKGKGRAGNSSSGGGSSNSNTLAPPSRAAGSSGSTSPAVSGKIGGGGAGTRALRHEIGGIKVETRYSGVDSLDESVGDSIVSMRGPLGPLESSGRDVTADALPPRSS